jgi:hypothetical protein
MTDFTSSIQQIPYGAERIFNTLSDLSQLSQLKDRLGDKLQDFRCDRDSCHFRVDPLGATGFQVVEREPFKTIKLQSIDSPIEVLVWIQLVEAGPEDTRLKLTLRADLPFFLKAMVSSKLEEGIEKIAQALASLPY